MNRPENTDTLDSLVKRLARHDHLSMRRAFLRVAGPFPLAGPAAWSNDWHAYRPCPYPHLHQGLDMFAGRGTPAVAVTNGVLTGKGADGISGLFAEITDRYGTKYFYCHFEALAPHLREGMRVHRGEVLGFVGNTGDAAGGATHLHFQVELDGVPSPPKPFVDGWLLRAIQHARVLAGMAPAESSTIEQRPIVDIAVPPPADAAAANTAPTGEALAMRPTTARASGGLGVPMAGLAMIAVTLALGVELRRRESQAVRSS